MTSSIACPKEGCKAAKRGKSHGLHKKEAEAEKDVSASALYSSGSDVINLPVVGFYFICYDLICLRINGSRKAVSHAGDKVAGRSVGAACSAHICADFFFLGIFPVYGGINAAMRVMRPSSCF